VRQRAILRNAKVGVLETPEVVLRPEVSLVCRQSIPARRLR
ncbi:uncharacterized protein METZ01_LOCUS419172, partial [marine metagenome]